MAPSSEIERVLTPYEEAFQELESRRADPGLQRRIEQMLGGDVPTYFKETPFFYLARHVATPNFETLRFLHLVEPLNMRIVITQDPEDKFVPHNPLKYSLGRLSLCKRVTAAGNSCIEQFETATIIDFNDASGKKLQDVRTVWGEPLIDFHNRLFNEIGNKAKFSICDESAWMNKRFRGDPLEYYKHLLPFFIAHGIMFEDYIFNDRKERDFVERYILPAFTYVEQRFGYRPLITNLVPTSIESPRFWTAYPDQVQSLIDARSAQPNGLPEARAHGGSGILST